MCFLQSYLCFIVTQASELPSEPFDFKASRNGFCARKKAKRQKDKTLREKDWTWNVVAQQQQHNQNEPFVERNKLSLCQTKKSKPFVTQSKSFLFFSLLLFCALTFFREFLLCNNFSLRKITISDFIECSTEFWTFTLDLNERIDSKLLSNVMIYHAMIIIHTLE